MPKRGDEASQGCGWGPKTVTVSRTGEARPGCSPPTLRRKNRPTHTMEGSVFASSYLL